MRYTVSTLMKDLGTFEDYREAVQCANKANIEGASYVEIKKVTTDENGNYYAESVHIYRK